MSIIKKIRTITLDTNIPSDIPSLIILQNKTKPSKEDTNFLKRAGNSLEVITLVSAVKLDVVGLDILKKELKIIPSLLNLYSKMLDYEVKSNSRVRKLANDYRERIPIKSPDALILALTSLNKIDCLLSWNREDIVKQSTLKIVKEINEKQKIPTPIITTPDDFLSRIILSTNKTITFFDRPVLSQYRPRFYPSKHILEAFY